MPNRNLQNHNAMPYKSVAQMRYFNANKKKLEKEGVNIQEWNDASKGKTKSLPYHVAKHKKKK
jgi:hypothetical protein